MNHGNPTPDPKMRKLCVDTIRMLSVDAVEAASSGHPGACLGAADLAYNLWAGAMRYDPACPEWADRDRFILSAGHVSMLLYSMLHLTGYDMPMEDIRRFRQRGSRASGHPEYRLAPGIETTTGPLGQGFANGVGMALAGRMLAARFNTTDFQPVTYRVFAYCGDGDMMEGITYEAASLAGHLGLGNLVYIYDSNRITIEGGTDLAFSDDVRRRFESLGWHVEEVDGYDHSAMNAALERSMDQTAKPSLIIASTVIGLGAPTMEGTERTHGAPLGADEVRALKQKEGWPLEPTFLIPETVRNHMLDVGRKAAEARATWDQGFARWRIAHPDLAMEWDAYHSGEAPADLGNALLAAASSAEGKATRVMSGKCMQALAASIPNFVGGSADLGPSNNTVLDGLGDVGPNAFDGRNLHFGIREHAMAAMVNGMALTGAFRPFCATFLVFSDYLKPTARLSALMELPVTYVFSHDSFHVGEDGPTHQPIEHLWMLRSIPGMTVFRPADPVEVAAAWQFAARRDRGPVCIVTTRQAVRPFLRPQDCGIDSVLRGGYVLREPGDGRMDAVVIATGSEVGNCLEAATQLAKNGIDLRVVSMSSLEVFLAQDGAYRDLVLPPGIRRVTVEAGSTLGWWRFLGRGDLAIGLDEFGACAPSKVLDQEFGFTAERLAERIGNWIRGEG